MLKAENITKRYKDQYALSHVDTAFLPGKIYGLFGRNGAGKTTLLSAMSAQISIGEGHVTLDDMPVWENSKALEKICFSRELSANLITGVNNFRVKDYLVAARIYNPLWDEAYAKRLLESFQLNPKKRINKLSKGMMSMVTIIIALASNAPYTFLDEPVAGLDVVARDHFYRLLMDNYTKTGRTFVISTHIIEEVEHLIEETILIDHGKILYQGELEAFLQQYHTVSGAAPMVDSAVAGLSVIYSQSLARHKEVCVKATLSEVESAVQGCDVQISPVGLQKLLVYLTEESGVESV